MTKEIKDDTAPQQRLCPVQTLKIMNFNRRIPMLSAVKDTEAKLHELIFGTENTTVIDLEEYDSIDEDSISAIKDRIRGINTEFSFEFNIKSISNHILIIQLPKIVNSLLLDLITKNINYNVITLFVPRNIKSTVHLQGKLAVLPELCILPDLQTATVVNWDAFVRLVTFLNEHENWRELHKVTPVGRFSVPFPDQSLIKMDIE